MHHIVKTFEEKGRFEDDSEADIIRQKLEMLVSSIQVEVAKLDERFQGDLIKSGCNQHCQSTLVHQNNPALGVLL